MIELRDYQREAVERVYNSWNAGNRNVLAVLPTGAGKSVIMSDVVKEFTNRNKHCAVIAHRNELVSQMSCHLARAGVVHRIIASNSTVAQITRKHRKLFGKSFINPSTFTAVVGVDTVISRYENLKEWGRQIDLWVQDECFPSGTKITTPDGFKNIEDIKVGDSVVAFNEKNQRFAVKKVISLFKKEKPKQMVSLTFAGHHAIKCTENHPFYTKRGWVRADKLTTNDEVLLYENNENEMYGLRKRNDRNRVLENLKIFKDGSGILFKRMCKKIHVKNFFGNNGKDEQKIRLRSYERKKPNEICRNTRKGFKNSENLKSQTTLSRWKRKTPTFTGKNTFGKIEKLGICQPVLCKNRSLPRSISTVLQNRCWKFLVENWNRSRRDFSQNHIKADARQEKRRISAWIRVENIEIQERRNHGKHRSSYVYNIGVDDFHTYIANKIVVHNCHHQLSTNKWGRALQLFSNARGLGVTATPSRADGQGLGRKADGFMDDMIIGPTTRYLIEHNYLADYEVVCPKSDLNLNGVETSKNGDWSNQALRKAAKKSRIVGDVVSNYMLYAPGRKAIVFATDVETAEEIATDFNNVGVKAVSLNGNSQTAYREQSIDGFADGNIQVLVNVDLFDEGFDVPACDVVIMARPTASLGKYLQMIGRGLRYQPGKVALVIDHVSNVLRHGLPDKPRQWSLNRRDRRSKQTKDPEEIELTTCKKCLKPYEKFRTLCPYCGFEKPLPDPRSRTIEMVEGDLVLLDRESLKRMRAQTLLESPADVGRRVANVAGPIAGKGVANRQMEKIGAQTALKEVIAQWAAIERLKGFNDREIHRKFYILTGLDVLSALSRERSRQDYEEMTNTVKGWYMK